MPAGASLQHQATATLELQSQRIARAPLWLGLSLGLLAAAVLATALLSGFTFKLRAPLDSILCYQSYFHRGTKNLEHANPWNFYFKALFYFRYGRAPLHTEGLIAGLAIIGALASLLPRAKALPRFLAFYTFALTVGYCLISYKTPWCALGFLHGMILLAGVGVVAIVSIIPWRALRLLPILLFLAGAANLGYQAHRLNFGLFRNNPSDPYHSNNRLNPYVYGHPLMKVYEIVKQVKDIAAASPVGNNLFIAVITKDCWPLPWYLRDMPRIGYWPEIDPDALRASLIITDRDTSAAINETLGDRYEMVYHGLRPGVPLAMFIRKDLWAIYLRKLGRI